MEFGMGETARRTGSRSALATTERIRARQASNTAFQILFMRTIKLLVLESTYTVPLLSEWWVSLARWERSHVGDRGPWDARLSS